MMDPPAQASLMVRPTPVFVLLALAATGASCAGVAQMANPSTSHPLVSALWALHPVIVILFGTLVVRFVGWATNGVTFDTWGAAFAAVLISQVVSWGAGSLLQGWIFPAPGDELTYSAFIARWSLIQLALHTVSFGIAALVLSGMHVKGAIGFSLVVIAFTAVNIATAYLPLLIS